MTIIAQALQSEPQRRGQLPCGQIERPFQVLVDLLLDGIGSCHLRHRHRLGKIR